MEHQEVFEGHVKSHYEEVTTICNAHYECASVLIKRNDRITRWHLMLSAFQLIFFIIAALGLSVSNLPGVAFISLMAGILNSIVIVIINAHADSYNTGMLVARHQQTTIDLWLIHEKYLSLLTDLSIGGKPIEHFRERYENLTAEFHQVCCRAPKLTI